MNIFQYNAKVQPGLSCTKFLKELITAHIEHNGGEVYQWGRLERSITEGAINAWSKVSEDKTHLVKAKPGDLFFMHNLGKCQGVLF